MGVSVLMVLVVGDMVNEVFKLLEIHDPRVVLALRSTNSYSDCTCVGGAPVAPGSVTPAGWGTATAGVCVDGDCRLFPVFLVLLFCMIVAMFGNTAVTTNFILQSLPFAYRSLGLGINVR